MSNLIPKWSTLRGAGNSRYSRLTVMTPVFGYIILYLDFFRSIPGVPLTPANAPANFQESAPIYLIYFGLCIFGVGVVIYQLFCSEIVKRYDDHISYVIAVAPNVSQIECEHIFQTIIASPSSGASVRSRADFLLKSINLSPEVNRENRVFALTEHYNILNTEKFVARLVSSIFMAVGALLTLIPTFITFGSIVGSLAR